MDTQPKRPNRLSLPQGGPLEKSQEYFSCSYPGCDYKSNWEENVGQHELGHDPKGLDCNIPCQVCPQTFLYLVSFLHHMTSKHSNKLFCPFCLFLGEDSAEFKAHVLAHKPATPRHRCETCAKTYKSKDSLYCHQKFYCASMFSTKATTSTEEIQAGSVCNSSVQNPTSSALESSHENVDSFKAPRSKSTRKDNKRRMEPKKSRQTLSDTIVNVDVEAVKRPIVNVAFQCSNCSKTFKHKCSVLQHQKNNCRIARLRCDKCSYRALHAQDLRRHIGIHLAGELLKCQHLGCDYTTLWTETLQKHQDSCKIRIPAPENSDGFSNLIENLMKEMKIFEGEFPFSCTFCRFTSASRYSVRKHLEVHVARAPLRCPRKGCNYKTKFSHFLRKHSRRVHPRKALIAPLKKPTNHPDARAADEKSEEATVQRALLITCDKCIYKTSSVTCMKYQSRIHSEKRPFKCRNDGCDYRTRLAHSLRSHQRWGCRGGQLGKRLEPIVPEIQKKPKRVRAMGIKKTNAKTRTAAANNYLGGEVEIETGQPTVLEENTAHLAPEITDIVAQRSKRVPMHDFVQANSQLPPGEMIKQILVGANTLFRCAICGYTSKRKPFVENHLVVHSDQKPFACPIGRCKYRSKWSGCMRQHLMVHKDQKPFACPSGGCKYRSKWSSNMRKHARIVHGLHLPRKMNLEFQESSGLCSSKTKSRSHLKKHHMIPVERAPLRCPSEVCKYQTKSSLMLSKHSRRVHPFETRKAPHKTIVSLRSDRKCKDKIVGFVSSNTVAFACMLCEFVGYSELSALKHSCQHRTVVISLNRI